MAKTKVQLKKVSPTTLTLFKVLGSNHSARFINELARAQIDKKTKAKKNRNAQKFDEKQKRQANTSEHITAAGTDSNAKSKWSDDLAEDLLSELPVILRP